MAVDDSHVSGVVRFTVHVRDYRKLYAIAGGWALLLITMSAAHKPALPTGSAYATSAGATVAASSASTATAPSA